MTRSTVALTMLSVEFLIALAVHVTRHARQRQIRHAEARRGGARLAHESLADQGCAGKTGFLCDGADPQHGGCTAPSAAHAGDDRVGAHLFQALRKALQDLAFLDRRGWNRTSV